MIDTVVTGFEMTEVICRCQPVLVNLKKGQQGFQDGETESGIHELEVQGYVRARLYCIVEQHGILWVIKVTLEHMDNSIDDILLKQAFLYLWELKYDGDQVGQITLGFL